MTPEVIFNEESYPQLPFPTCWSGNTQCEGRAFANRSWEVALNQQVKDLIQKLGEAIHESVSESEQIAAVVREIRENGFDVLLMLEATIGLNQLEEDEAEVDEGNQPAEGPFTRNDLTFLKSLRITTEERGEPGTAAPPDA